MLWFATQGATGVAALPLPAFLTGCHEERREARWTEECWTAPRGDMMLGSGRNGQADKVTGWEWMRIERGPEGVPVFYGSPGGAPGVAFRAVSASATEIVFTNPAHDYPQRIRYTRTAGGSKRKFHWPTAARPSAGPSAIWMRQVSRRAGRASSLR